MPIDTSFIKLFIKATEKAAYGAYLFKGKGDKNAADKSAVDMMRTELNSIKMHGKVVIGEGELDEAPMLYIGETLGKSKEPKFDIAVDPLEGTKFCAQGLPNAFAVMAVSETGNLLSAPDTYMEKIVIGPNLPKGLVDLDYPIEKNIDLLANAKNVKPSELTACVLDRPRHSKIIEGLKKKNKSLPSSLFYDEKGIDFFNKITSTEAYYPTKTEINIYQNQSKLISNKLDQNFQPTDGYRTSFTQTLPLISDDKAVENSFNASKYYSVNDNLILSPPSFFPVSVGPPDTSVIVFKPEP